MYRRRAQELKKPRTHPRQRSERPYRDDLEPCGLEGLAHVMVEPLGEDHVDHVGREPSARVRPPRPSGEVLG
jgi:hypothetical protein